MMNYWKPIRKHNFFLKKSWLSLVVCKAQISIIGTSIGGGFFGILCTVVCGPLQRQFQK
jgi:hypothetical protein